MSKKCKLDDPTTCYKCDGDLILESPSLEYAGFHRDILVLSISCYCHTCKMSYDNLFKIGGYISIKNIQENYEYPY